MSRRSTPLIGLGAAALAIGAAATFAALRSDDAPSRVNAATGNGQADGADVAGVVDFKIPEGRQALAVALDPVAGTAGVARAGSHIDVFAAVTRKDDQGRNDNAARMLIQNVEVLRVDTGAGIANAANAVTSETPTAPAGTTVFVLAVTPAQAEKLVYHAAFSRLWFSVMPSGQKPVPPTPGVNAGNQLNPEAV
jgi:Flp pilus assembly protein CpaB